MNIPEYLLETALTLIGTPSVSRQEAALTSWIAQECQKDPRIQIIHQQENAVLFGRPGPWSVVLAGHSDTVPEQGNLPPRLKDGWIHGLGAADMKGSLAVMLALAHFAPEFSLNPLFAIFGQEELTYQESALTPLLASVSALTQARLAIVMEPTANQLHAGCLGNIKATLTFHGRAAHSARPWLGDNAIHAAVRGLAKVASSPPVEVEIDGLTYREVLSVTEISGGIANNVIPDRVVCGLNFRYAGSRTPPEAGRVLKERVGEAGDLAIVSNAPGAPAALDNELLRRLREQAQLEVRPKQAWTPVAEFAAAGVDAVNFGPGDPDFAHRRDERVSLDAMLRSFEILRDFLCD